ncbi:glycosyltransferase family 2 protein [Kineothrix sp. MSJ-39]|uniref:glycosyltransferase family 2 protein n=1 Tax=Kineothrix sp. MSJ-39 TaxID=2841533 RepID=UPI001C0F882A|nr:glycosyltransferase family 2 protein [Kineothrix sp. MSJ-39]MBU5431048.1 glycosyltransferase family 2 protein [Kineothrix sp. MSJ-39]
MKKISIIIPCYNVELYIDDCFNSLKKQTIDMDSLEIIIVNDASTDNTLEHILAFEKEYPESVLVINLTENIKQGGARNIALQYATGEYISFLDADDWVDNDFYEDLYHIARKYNAEIVQFPFRRVLLDEDGKVIKEKIIPNSNYVGYYSIQNNDDRKHFLNGRLINCGSQSKFYNGDFIRKLQPSFIPKVAYEEPSFVYPLLLKVNRIYCYEKPKYNYRIHTGSTMQSYVSQKGKLYDHPFVQLSVFEKIRNDSQIYNQFKEEIDYYFLFSFWVETIYFAKSGSLYIGFDFFQIMKDSIQNLLPTWYNNIYIKLPENQDILDIIKNGLSVSDQEALNDYINAVEFS